MNNHTTKEQKKTWGRMIQRLMIERGLHPSELARRADMPRNNISTYINGRSYPSPENLTKLATALGVPVEQITISPEPDAHNLVRIDAHRRARIEAKLDLLLTMARSQYRVGVFG